MSIWRYLKDRAGLIVTFASILIFSASAVRLGERHPFYVVLTGGVAALFYLAVNAYRTLAHVGKVKRAVEQPGTDWTYALPAPETGEQLIYHDALVKLRDESDARFLALKAQSAEELEFLTLWVHEIKTPIAAGKLLIESALNKPDERTLYAVGDELSRIEDYVQQSLFYVRAGEFATDYRIDSVPLRRAVETALQNEYATISGRHLKLELSGLDVVVDSDEKWATFIIKQLLDNAVKYSPDGGTVRISAEQQQDGTMLTVSDEGVGIRPEDIRRVFQKSFTGNNGRSYYNSTGIGLYLAHKLAEKLSHRLTVSSECGKGTTFMMWIKREGEEE